jgi:hypothetical protein
VSRYGWVCEEFFVVNVERETRDFVHDGIFQGLMLLTHCAKPVVDRSSSSSITNLLPKWF